MRFVTARGLLLAIGFAAVWTVFPLSVTRSDASHTFIRFPWTYAKEGYITQGYNGITHQGDDYYALDVDVEFAFVNGDIRAAATGTVVGLQTGLSCGGTGYGNYVDIGSTTPTGASRYARYAHLSSVSVFLGQYAYQGQKIGVEGDSGYTINCGDHLHFRWTSTQSCSGQSCAVEPEPMSGEPGASGYADFAAGQTWVSDNSDRPPVIEGMLIRGSGASVYVVDNGAKRHITSDAVFASCGYNWNEVAGVSDTALNLMVTGAGVTGRPCPYTLMRAPGNPAVYHVAKGIKRHVANLDIFAACGYDWGVVVEGPLPSGTGAAITNPPCPYARRPWHSDSILEGALVRGSGPSTYLVDLSGKRHITSPDAFVACGYRWNDVVTIADSALSLITTSGSIFGPPCPHSLIRPPGLPDTYVIQNLLKVHIASSDVFAACGYNWDQVVIVNPPSGSGVLASPPCPYTRD